MSSSRGGNSNSRGLHSFSISRNVARVAAARNLELMESMLPACGCYLPMKMYISTTYENQGRRFWKCRNWNMRSAHTCELFIWDDDIIPGVTPMIHVETVMDVSVEQERSGRSGVEAINSQQACSKCSNIEEVMKTFESIEVDKWKTKYSVERNKVMWMALALMISFFFFFFVCLC
ncbi:putative transcription factor GRF family [Medicago truncatula]|uniref:Putative transcription factor GRF family n=1 Tax=Medicago truncatula TaxID=3880 RepID=A0A396HJ41_MEDTR|nr:putative transcription factor GRF family [Medicago truncatula]